MAQPAARRQISFIRLHESVIGTKVVNAQNEDLGSKIEDLVIEGGLGRVQYAVLSFGGFLGLGDKDFLIPWNAFSFDLANNRAMLNVDKDRLKNAPGFDGDATNPPRGFMVLRGRLSVDEPATPYGFVSRANLTSK